VFLLTGLSIFTFLFGWLIFSRIVKDVGSPDYVPLFVDDEFDESGQPNYVEVGGRVE
jgi:hypothetical protein